MDVCLDEHRLGALRWIVLRGPGREAFRALGEHTRAQISALAEDWPLLPRLRAYVCGPPGRDRLAAVQQASAERFAAVWAELAALAAGAAVPLADLALLNFRGDLGQVTGGIGCSDLAWRRERSFIGHNEDGAPENVGQCALLTLVLDGMPAVTAFWYPGFLPSNAFAVTGDGLVWTIDHLPVASPGDGAGRHFVGRGLQRSGIPATDPGPAWFLDVLAGASLPEGVRCDPQAGRGATTLCTLVADLTAGEAVFAARDDAPVTIPLLDLAEGNPHAQRSFAAARE